MSSVVSRLDPLREKQLLKLFPQPVKLSILYKGCYHGNDFYTLKMKSGNEGNCVLIIYLQSGGVRGVYLKETFFYAQTSDKNAFLFEVSKEGGTKYPVVIPSKAAVNDDKILQFGDSIKISTEQSNIKVAFRSTDSIYTSTGWSTTRGTVNCEIELHRVQDLGDLLLCDWRHLSWTERTRDDLMKDVVSFRAPDLPRVKGLLLGPAGAGKSSIIVSARSVMYKRVIHLPIVGNLGGFTKQLTSYEIRAKKGGSPIALRLCDAMAIGDGEVAGLSSSDALAIIKGHVPEGYKFQTEDPISDKMSGYRATPSLEEQVHCVIFVLDASKMESYSNSLRSTIRELHREISDLCVPQLILLTHIDQVCHAVHEDVKYVYSSRTLQQTIEEAAKLVNMPISCVLPIKNYNSEHSVNCSIDILLLDAIHHILQAIDDMLEDRFPPTSQEPPQ